MRRIPDTEVWNNYVVVDDCWIWIGRLNTNGYPKLGARYAHIIAYRLTHGEIPVGYEIDHTCRTPSCVNPEHLEAVTHKENLRRARLLVIGHCRKGHIIQTPADLYVRPDGTGACCRACRDIRWSKFSEGRRAKTRSM